MRCTPRMCLVVAEVAREDLVTVRRLHGSAAVKQSTSAILPFPPIAVLNYRKEFHRSNLPTRTRGSHTLP